MRLLEHYLLQEKKDHLINKLPNLSQEEKANVIAFFTAHANLENKIDWNNKNLTMADFEQVMKANEQSHGKIKKNGIAAFQEGIDYLDVTKPNDKGIVALIPLKYKFQKFIQSKDFMGREAAWCIGYQKTSEYWIDYFIERENNFLILANKNAKFALQFESIDAITIWDEEDEQEYEYEITYDRLPTEEHGVAVPVPSHQEEYYDEETDEYYYEDVYDDEEEEIDSPYTVEQADLIRYFLDHKTDFQNNILEAEEAELQLAREEGISELTEERLTDLENEYKKLLNEASTWKGADLNKFLKDISDRVTHPSQTKRFYPLITTFFENLKEYVGVFDKVDFSNFPDFDISKLKINIQDSNSFMGMFARTRNLKVDLSNIVVPFPMSLYCVCLETKNCEIKLPKMVVTDAHKLCSIAENSTLDFSNCEFSPDSDFNQAFWCIDKCNIIFPDNFAFSPQQLSDEKIDQYVFAGMVNSSINVDLTQIAEKAYNRYNPELAIGEQRVYVQRVLGFFPQYVNKESPIFENLKQLLEKSFSEGLINPLSGFDGSYCDINLDFAQRLKSLENSSGRFDICQTLFMDVKNVTVDWSNILYSGEISLMRMFDSAENCHVKLGPWTISGISNLFLDAKNCSIDVSLCDLSRITSIHSAIAGNAENCKIIWGNNALPNFQLSQNALAPRDQQKNPELFLNFKNSLNESSLLQEKKDHLIKKLDGLNDIEKETLIDFFATRPSFESKIDWNRKDLTFSDFEELLKDGQQTRGAIKRNGLDAFKINEDYIDISKDDDIKMFIPLSYKFQKFVQSADFYGIEAEWCIGYQKNNFHWNHYHKQGNMFVIIVTNGAKLAIQVEQNGNIIAWDRWDNQGFLAEGSFDEIPTQELIEHAIKHKQYFLKELKKAKPLLVEILDKQYVAEIRSHIERFNWCQGDKDDFKSAIRQLADWGASEKLKVQVYDSLYQAFTLLEDYSELFSGHKFNNFPGLDFSKMKLNPSKKSLPYSMFKNTQNLVADLSHWHFEEAESWGDQADLFKGCMNAQVVVFNCTLTALEGAFFATKNCIFDMKNVNIPKIDSMTMLFSAAKDLTILNFDPKFPPETDCEGIFQGCEELNIQFNNSFIEMLKKYHAHLFKIVVTEKKRHREFLVLLTKIKSYFPDIFETSIAYLNEHLADIFEANMFGGVDMSQLTGLDLNPLKLQESRISLKKLFFAAKNLNLDWSNYEYEADISGILANATNSHINLGKLKVIDFESIFYRAENCSLDFSQVNFYRFDTDFYQYKVLADEAKNCTIEWGDNAFPKNLKAAEKHYLRNAPNTLKLKFRGDN